MHMQETALKQKQEAKKKPQPPVSNLDTATSSHAPPAAAGASDAAAVLAPDGAASNSPAGLAPGAEANLDGARRSEGEGGSAFSCVSAIMGWETFHVVHVLWIGLVDLPGKAPEKDWEMQVGP